MYTTCITSRKTGILNPFPYEVEPRSKESGIV